MGKKCIDISLRNSRGELSSLFEEYSLSDVFELSQLESNIESYYNRYGWDGVGVWWDDDDDFGGWDYYSKHVSSSKSKKGKSKKDKDDYNPYFDRGDDDDIMDGGKVEIWFYEDIDDKYSRLCFDTLDEFDTFCSERGYIVSSEAANEIVYNYISHCCLNPYALLLDGSMEILVEESYADLFYACNELLDGTKDINNLDNGEEFIY